ncbi:MAG TPA: hypothetical protein VE011_02615 [Candidatus Dormibacteraeota bacterium]|nr:hypothetical protein [Candidatus Dormibacteraeota bacterium]
MARSLSALARRRSRPTTSPNGSNARGASSGTAGVVCTEDGPDVLNQALRDLLVVAGLGAAAG